ncbi:hypothetical protein SD80_011335 [Scytonema tolypothrichoides VB-61278]|nr:hypothetical protein SD80_011335 [Scytonema tolypothrichoides VB-61278]
MTRQPHDQFAKQYLEELLSPLGKVEVSREVTDEVRQVDILFSPTASPDADPQSLGLLGRIAASASLLEPFRNPPSKTEVRNCILKLFSVCGEFQRKAKRESTSLPEDNLPRLWILAPSASAALLDSFGARLELENWSSGIYFLPKSFRTGIVAINQLPVTNETLWFRLLGRGTVQQQAVRELIALPRLNSLRRNVLELIFNWRVSVEVQENLTEEEQELIVNLSEAYREARAAAVQEGQRSVVENLLKVKFGSLDDELSRVIDVLLQLPPEEFARVLLQLPNLSREGLLERFARGGS